VLAPTAQFAVPSVTGDTVAAAAAALGQAGLKVSATTTSACSNTVAIGNVVKTTPAANTNVTSGTTVTLVTSSGHCEVSVPDVLDETETVASSTMTKAGLTPQITQASPSACTAAMAGAVAQQSLAANTMTPYNSVVVLSVCPVGTTGATGATVVTG